MEDLTQLVALNLKRIREEKNLSLDKLSDFSGVSKSMLSQIERGDLSPTIATLWKIANGLKVSFTALLESPQNEPTVVHRSDLKPLMEDNGRYRLYPLFPIEEGRRFEVYTVEIEPGGSLEAEAHPAGTSEFLTVYSGELTVRLGGQDFRVEMGGSIPVSRRPLACLL